MPACHNIRFIHNVKEETVAVAAHFTEDGRIAAAASRTDEQHHRAGNRQSCPLDAKPLRAR